MTKEVLQSFPGQVTNTSPEMNLRFWLAVGTSLAIHGLLLVLLVLGGHSASSAISELATPIEVSFRVSQDVAPSAAAEVVPVAQQKVLPLSAVRNTDASPQKSVRHVLAVDAAPDIPGIERSQVKSGDVLNMAATDGAEAGGGVEGIQAVSGGGKAVQEDVLREYRGALIRAAKKVRRYPPLAREQGWEGVAQVRVSQEPGGGQLMVRLEESSRYGLLDEQALLMLQKAVARAPVPESLLGQSFTLMLPVEFSLDQP